MPKDAKNKKEKNNKKRFFKDFKAELKKVIWPTPKQLVNNTVAVITIVLLTAVIVFVLDFTFEKMNTYGVNRLKEAVQSKNEIVNEDAAEEKSNNETVENQDTSENKDTASEETQSGAEESTSEAQESETSEQAE